MRTVNHEARNAKKIAIMEKCFDCYAENGLNSVGVNAIADECGQTYLWLYRNTVLESGPYPGDQGTGIAFIEKMVLKVPMQQFGWDFVYSLKQPCKRLFFDL